MSLCCHIYKIEVKYIQFVISMKMKQPTSDCSAQCLAPGRHLTDISPPSFQQRRLLPYGLFPAGKHTLHTRKLSTSWPPRSTFQLIPLTQANRAKLRTSCQYFNVPMPQDPTLSEAEEMCPSHISSLVLQDVALANKGGTQRLENAGPGQSVLCSCPLSPHPQIQGEDRTEKT